jgi:putative transposase
MQIGVLTRCYPEPFLAEEMSHWVDGVRSLKNGKTADEQYQFWLRSTAILSPSWNGPNPQGEPVIDQTYAQYKDAEQSPWLSGVPSQLLRNRAVQHYTAWQNHFRDPKAMRVPTFQEKGKRDTIWLTKELFRVKRLRKRWLTLEIGTEAHPVGCLRVRLHRPKGNAPIVAPSFDSIHIRRMAWGTWMLSGSYEDGLPTTELDTVLARVRAMSPADQEAAVQGVDRGIRVILATSAGRKADLPETAKARIEFLDGKIKHFQRQLSRQKKGSKSRFATKAKIARERSEITGLVDEFLCQEAAIFANQADLHLGAFEGLKIKNMTRRPKAKWSPAQGRYLRNNASAKAGLNRAFLRVAPGKAKQRFKNALAKRGKGLVDATAAYSSQECSKCHDIHADNRKGEAFKCLECGHEDHADTNAAKVIQQRGLKSVRKETVVQKTPKKTVTGRKIGKQRAEMLARSTNLSQGMPCEGNTGAVTLGAGPNAPPATVTAGVAGRARPSGGSQQAPMRLGDRAVGALSHPGGKGRKSEGAKAPDAAFVKRETPSSSHAVPGHDHGLDWHG